MQSLSLRLTPPTTLFPLSFLNSFKPSSSEKKKRFCDANAAISLLSISVLSPDSYSWSSERIVYSCRNVFNSVEDVLICHQVCFSLEVHWRSANHNPSPCRWRKRLNRVWEVSLLMAAERHNEDYTPDVSRPKFLMKDPEAE